MTPYYNQQPDLYNIPVDAYAIREEKERQGQPLFQSLLNSVSNFITPSAEASPALATAMESYIGQGEQGGNNRGKFVKSLGGREGDPWCSSLVSKATKDVGEDVFGFLPMARQWWNEGRKKGYAVDEPQRGDIAIFKRGKGASGHVGVVGSTGKNSFTLIAGNEGKYPSVVRKRTVNRDTPELLGFIRTPPAQAPIQQPTQQNSNIDWQAAARSTGSVQNWWKQFPESAYMDIIDFMNTQKKQGIYDYQKALEAGELPSYQLEHKQYRWNDMGKLRNNPSPAQQPMDFSTAFANARKAGLKTFVWNGELKTTKLK